MNKKINAPVIVIIGAPRSGTNMLRDVLCSLPGVETWPCDEINYIWKYGNRAVANDRFTAEMVNAKSSRYIKSQFNKLQRKTGAQFIVEKTCANSLRVPFIESVLEQPKYIFIYRDPVDVVASALKRWRARLDIGYILKKARYIPLGDVPWYASRYLCNRLRKLVSKSGTLSVWGPVTPSMDKLNVDSELERICATQWKDCYGYAEADLSKVPRDRVFRLRYEEFVAEPGRYLKEIMHFCGMPELQSNVPVLASVSTASLNKGRESLSPEAVAIVEQVIA